MVPTGDQVRLRSSHCLDGCFADRQSPGDPRVIRLDGGEDVIFEETGPGAITRIWMTTGPGHSEAFPPAARIRVYLDDDVAPRVDLALADLFAGTTAPFTPPLVADRLASSGGYVSYVPIPYAASCRVTLSGADDIFLWYQLTSHRLSIDQAVTSFTGSEDLSALRAWLASTGDDPWPTDPGAVTTSGAVTLAGGDMATVLAADGPGLLTGVWLAAPPASWDALTIRLTFDGDVSVDLPLRDLFGIGRAGAGGLPTRSLLVGTAANGELYAYFPMPYARAVAVTLVNHADDATSVAVDYRIRRRDGPLLSGSGRFAAALAVADPAPLGSDFLFLNRDGPGKWVGSWAELSSVGTLDRRYLEGDERVFVDGARHPALYGTGVEDFFGGGFFFDQGPFRQALHGMTYHLVSGGEDVTASYRLLLGDAVPFQASLRAGLELGSQGDVPLRARVVSWHYARTAPGLTRVDVLDVGDPASRASHGYATAGLLIPVQVTGSFEGEPPVELAASAVTRDAGPVATFGLDAGLCGCGNAPAPGCDDGRRLRRLFDAAAGDQRWSVSDAPAHEVGRLPWGEANPDRRWRELDVDLPNGTSTAHLEVAGAADGAHPLSEARYELWCRPETPLFADGFETGDPGRWAP